ncbi:MAG: hypothetical protein LBV04_10390 [Deferribacteraceae bacterium]|jgi:hypothetical protein|nr:hypothetical protein [Deferribacteraceae bacterium]
MLKNITKTQRISAQSIVQTYIRIVETGSAHFNRVAIEKVADLLYDFSKEMLIKTIKNYSDYCQEYHISKQFRYDSNTFFKSGIFALYLYDNAINTDHLMAYECSSGFTPQGNCKSCRNKISYCKYCNFNKSRQDMVGAC